MPICRLYLPVRRRAKPTEVTADAAHLLRAAASDTAYFGMCWRLRDDVTEPAMLGAIACSETATAKL